MFESLSHFRDAASTLGQDAVPLRQQLNTAAVELTIVVTRPEQWPGELLKEAKRIDRELFAEGSTQQTIAAMTDLQTSRVAGEIIRLAKELESERTRLEQ